MSGAQLNGWKEIAEFFGKSPRTVQRWEADLGLPVKRIKTSAGDIVFAMPEDLARWRAARTEAPPDVADGPSLEDGGPTPSQPATRARPRRAAARWAWGVLIVVVLSVPFWNRGGLRGPAEPAPVATAEFRGSTIVARDLAGVEVWTYRFESALWTRPPDPYSPFTFTPGDPPVVADIDRDGVPEVLAIVTFGDPNQEPYRQQLVCVSSSGAVRWIYRPDMHYTFRGRSAGPSGWQFLDMLVAEGSDEPAVFVSLASAPWWPSVVVRIDGKGDAEVRYVSSGSVYAIEQVSGPNGWRLLAGGVNNDYDAAALAIIPEHGPASASPQKEGSPYECLDCPTGRPLSYLLFPRTDVNIGEGDQPYNKVWNIRKTGADVDIVTVESASHSAFCFYTLTPALEPVRLALSDSTAHQVLESAGKLDHREADCPLRRQGASVRKWTPDGGWVTLTVPVTPR